MRLIKKLSMLLVLTAPMALGCGSNQSSPQQQAPVILQPTAQPLLPTPPEPVPAPPTSVPGAPVVVLIQNVSVPSTGGTMAFTGTNLPEHPVVTFTSPAGDILPAAFVARDQNNPSQLLVGSPNIQAAGKLPGRWAVTVTDPTTGLTATGPNLFAQISAQMISFSMTNAPNASSANHLGSGMDADPITIIADDLNNDGTKDFVVGNRDDQSVSVLFRGPSINPNYSVLNLGTGHVLKPASVVTGDFNGDNKKDIVIASQNGITASKLVTQQAGNGALSSSQDFPLVQVSNERALGTGDFNLDGKQDIVAVGTGTAHNFNVEYGTGDLNGSFTHQGSNSFLPGAYALAVGQLDNDASRPDVMLINHAKAQILSNQADPVATQAHFVIGDTVSIDGSYADRRIAPGDINGDGIMDLVVTSYGNEVEQVLSNASNGIWKSKDAIPAGANHPGAIAMADLNGDGLLDIAVITDHNKLSVYLGLPSPWDLAPSSIGANTNLDPLKNRAGKFDFDHPQTFTVCDQPQSVVACDTNGDGAMDLAIACKQDDLVQVLTNTSS